MLRQTANNRQATIPITSTIISQQTINQPRSFISIVNTSLLGEIVYVSDGQEAVVGAGVPLSPGGVYQDTIIGTGSDPIYPSQEAYHIIASAPTATVAIMEKVVVGDQ